MTTTSTTPATECPMCRYTSGHTSWCPNGGGSPLVTADEQAAVAASIAARDSIEVGSTVKLAPLFCNPADRDLRLEVTALGEHAVALRVIGTGRELTIARQAIIAADDDRVPLERLLPSTTFQLVALAAAINADETLNARVAVVHLGGNVEGLIDGANGLGITLNDGQRAVDTDEDGPATMIVWHEDDPEVEVANGEVRTIADALELLGTVVGRG